MGPSADVTSPISLWPISLWSISLWRISLWSISLWRIRECWLVLDVQSDKTPCVAVPLSTIPDLVRANWIMNDKAASYEWEGLASRTAYARPATQATRGGLAVPGHPMMAPT